MFDIRLRVYSDSVVRGRVLKTLNLTVTDNDSSTPKVDFAVSRRVAGYLESPFLVGVEVSYGGAWVSPRNNIFICLEDSGDDTDNSETVNFTGVGLLPWLFQYMYVQGTSTTGIKERTWPNATPGTILAALVSEAQAWGWGPQVSVDFTATHDSAGQAWQAADRTDITWSVGSTGMSEVLDKLSEQGLIEWWVEGTTLRVFRAGMGSDRSTSVALGGAGFARMPRKSSFDGVFTRATVFLDDGKFFNTVNPGADGRFGTLWATITQSGVKSQAVAEKLIQPALTLGRAKREELSYDWSGSANLPMPVRDFTIGDVVTARRRDTKSPQRVIGWVVSKAGQEVTIRAVVGSKLLSLTAKLAKRSAAASVGTIIGGSGKGFPSGRGPSSAVPAAPTNLRVTSNVGVWRRDGESVANVGVAWDAVTQATDGSALNVREYEVWSRIASGAASVAARTSSLTGALSRLVSSVPLFLTVRAQSHDGVWSDFSTEISVTPAQAVSEYPKAPTNLSVVSNVGAFQPDGSTLASVTVEWEPVSLSTDDLPLVVTGYEVWDGTVDDPGIVLVATRETSVSFTIPSGSEKALRVRVKGVSGVWSDFSEHVVLTAAVPAPLSTIPNAPTLQSERGIVVAMFDGQSTTGPVGYGFQHVITEISADQVEWVRVGQTLSAPGAVILSTVPIGTEVFVRFLPVDTLGRVGTASDVSTIVCVGITGPDIEANSISTNHVVAGSIQASHLVAGIGGELDLWANSAITMLIGQQEDTQGQVDALALWLRLDEDGLHMGRTDSPFQTHMREDSFSITENGVETTYWEAGRMVVPLLVTEEADIAGVKFQKYGTGTVVKRLG